VKARRIKRSDCRRRLGRFGKEFDMIDRVKCIQCDNMILPQTAAKKNGLCAPCAGISPELRAAKREYARSLSDGSVFRPSDEELASSSVPEEILNSVWNVQPEYYAEMNMASASAAIIAAMPEPQGNVVLVNENGGQLNLGFTNRYGVVEFQNPESGEFRYAYSDANVRDQVPKELHVVQACPCCGVGMLWYPSRYHMPREKAFSILESVVANRDSQGVRWLAVIDDISYTRPGVG